MKNGKLTPTSWAMYRTRMNTIKRCLPTTLDTRILNESHVENLFSWLSDEVEAERLSGDTATSTMVSFRSFVRYLWKHRICDLPRNLDDTEFRFQTIGRRAIMPVETIQTLLGAANDRAKCYLLLMLNCGFINSDIANLRPVLNLPEQKGIKVLDGEFLVWKRHKGWNKKNVPIVTYWLWPETRRLLAKEVERCKPINKTDRLFCTEDGYELAKDLIVNGKHKKSDAIKLVYRRAFEAAGLKGNARSLRSTAVCKLDEHGEYGRYARHFLGQAPNDVTRKHYVAPSAMQFSESVKWLGRQFGF